MRLKPSALVIDDDPMFCQALESVLGRFGLNIKTTNDPEVFMDYSEKLTPDLYLVDLQLGDTSGFDLISRVRAKAPDSIIIIISGSKEKSDIAHALELGANDYILKPLNRVLLASKLSLYLDTDHIREHRAEFTKFTETTMTGVLIIDGVVEEVDELGLKIMSPHLIPKGTVVKINSDFFGLLGAQTQEYLVSVTSTSFNPEAENYSMYVEFEDSVDPEIHQLLRRWLIQRL